MKVESVIVAVEKELKEAANDEDNETPKDTDDLLQKSEKEKKDADEIERQKNAVNDDVKVHKEQSQLKNGKLFSKVKPSPTFDAFLGYIIVFGLIMFYFYLTDYRKVHVALVYCAYKNSVFHSKFTNLCFHNNDNDRQFG